MVTLLVFIIATLEIKKKLFDAKGPVGDNVIKNRARNARSTIFRFTCHFSISLPIRPRPSGATQAYLRSKV